MSKKSPRRAENRYRQNAYNLASYYRFLERPHMGGQSRYMRDKFDETKMEFNPFNWVLYSRPGMAKQNPQGFLQLVKGVLMELRFPHYPIKPAEALKMEMRLLELEDKSGPTKDV